MIENVLKRTRQRDSILHAERFEREAYNSFLRKGAYKALIISGDGSDTRLKKSPKEFERAMASMSPKEYERVMASMTAKRLAEEEAALEMESKQSLDAPEVSMTVKRLAEVSAPIEMESKQSLAVTDAPVVSMTEKRVAEVAAPIEMESKQSLVVTDAPASVGRKRKRKNKTTPIIDAPVAFGTRSKRKVVKRDANYVDLLLDESDSSEKDDNMKTIAKKREEENNKREEKKVLEEMWTDFLVDDVISDLLANDRSGDFRVNFADSNEPNVSPNRLVKDCLGKDVLFFPIHGNVHFALFLVWIKKNDEPW
jgi:hypothetical protein